MANEKRVFIFNGNVPEKCSAKPEAPISPTNGLRVIRAALMAGRKHDSEHFKRRARERGFDSPDAHNVIFTGELRSAPEYCEDFGTWKYRVIGDVEDRQLEIVVALDPGEDYEASPLIIFLTGYWRFPN